MKWYKIEWKLNILTKFSEPVLQWSRIMNQMIHSSNYKLIIVHDETMLGSACGKQLALPESPDSQENGKFEWAL